MNIFLYILIISLIFRLFINLLYFNPGIALVLMVGFIIYSVIIKRKRRLQGWNQHAYYRNQQSDTMYRNTSNSNSKDVFEAEYTEHEVH